MIREIHNHRIREMVSAWSWTNDCTAHDQATFEPKVKVPYGHLECQNYVYRRGGKGNVALPH